VVPEVRRRDQAGEIVAGSDPGQPGRRDQFETFCVNRKSPLSRYHGKLQYYE
jgi:hypothetical protein